MRKNLFDSYINYSFHWLTYFLILVKRFSSDKARELVQWENMIADAFMNRLELEEKKNIENRVINTQESYVQYYKLLHRSVVSLYQEMLNMFVNCTLFNMICIYEVKYTLYHCTAYIIWGNHVHLIPHDSLSKFCPVRSLHSSSLSDGEDRTYWQSTWLCSYWYSYFKISPKLNNPREIYRGRVISWCIYHVSIGYMSCSSSWMSYRICKPPLDPRDRHIYPRPPLIRWSGCPHKWTRDY